MGNINRNQPGIEQNHRKLRVLVAPLDWGLGHATRCIPVIYELLRQNAEVFLAGEGAQEKLLRQEFPGLALLPLRGYRVNYSRSAAGFLRTLLFQTPRIIGAIRAEHRWLKQAVADHQLDGVISDNRFGLYHDDIPSVFITHQLAIRSPLGDWSEGFLRKRNYRYINRFTSCWVPDQAGVEHWAGSLSHPMKMPLIPVRYIGILSRLKKTGVTEKKDHLFISLSGPEPQRSMLENKIIEEISHYNGSATVVRGLPHASSHIPSTNDIHFYNHLPSEEFGKEMEAASIVVSRSGYSTVMDILRLEKRSILIPTPGQTEQEYLANHLEEMQVACTSTQKDFSLIPLLQKANAFEYRIPALGSTDELEKTISAFLESLK